MEKFERLIAAPVEIFFLEILREPTLLFQFICAGIAVSLAKILSLYTKRYLRQSVKISSKYGRDFVNIALKVTTITYAIILLSITGVIFDKIFSSHQIILAITKLLVLLFILRIVSSVSKKQAITKMLGLILVPILVLSITGLLSPTVKYLDSIAFSVGKLKLSLYLVIKGAIILTLLVWTTRLIIEAVSRYIRRIEGISYNTRELLIKFFGIILYLTAFFITLNILGIDLTALAVFGGALGVGIGFGLQKITSNFISGIILLADKSIKPNDLIEIEGNTPVHGIVKHMGIRSVLVENFDGREILIPCEELVSGKVTNWTYSNTRGRVEIKLGVAYGSDLDKVKELLIEAAQEHPMCINYPEVECFLIDFADSSINFVLYFWVDDITKGRQKPRSDVMFSIWDKFKKNGIEIPYPQREVHIKNA